jgi:tetratricopeptide (TPR) repeat protein
MRPTSRSEIAFLALALAAALLLPLLSFDFGISEDERLHDRHGRDILDWFLGASDRAVRQPLDTQGRLEFAYDAESRDLSGALNIYGGFFDLLCAAAQRWVSPFGTYETRHLINSLFGVLLVVGAGCAARWIAGARAGVLALLMTGLSPRIVGHSMNNHVDAPFAALYLLGLLAILRFVGQLPRPRPSAWVAVALGVALAIDVRIAGLVLPCYLGLFAGLWSAWRLRRGGPGAGREAARALGLAALLGAGGYLLSSLAWPLAHADPLGTPLRALRHLSRLETFNARDLFEGRWIDSFDAPWYFAPKWMLIGTPLFFPLGLLLVPLAFRRDARAPVAADSRRRLLAAALLWAGLFPLAFVILRRSNLYNDARHVLFAYPPLLVVAALAVDGALERLRRPARLILLLALAATLVEPLRFMVRNHPYAGVYFSPAIGGVDRAFRRYETDFWGQSVRRAVEWIQAQPPPVPGRPVRVRLWYGDPIKAAYYLARRPGFEHVVADVDSDGWDYSILTTVECKFAPEFLARWPPPGTVYEVRVERTPLCAVLLNARGDPDELFARARRWAVEADDHATYYALGALYDDAGRGAEALEAFKQALAREPGPTRRTPEEYLALARRLARAGARAQAAAAGRLARQRDSD